MARSISSFHGKFMLPVSIDSDCSSSFVSIRLVFNQIRHVLSIIVKSSRIEWRVLRYLMSSYVKTEGNTGAEKVHVPRLDKRWSLFSMDLRRSS